MKYTEEHEWLDADDGVITVGITEHASGKVRPCGHGLGAEIL
ncbi:MAG: hypothetical protein AAFQ50_09215 [Pseudomonadota bacterium]